MVDQDPDATTDDMADTIHAVGIAAVPPAEPHEAPAPPPPVEAEIDEVFRWLATVSATLGAPDGVDVSATIRHVSVAAPDQAFFARWMAAIGAVARTNRHDALGSTVIATTPKTDRWTVTVHAHVPTNGMVSS